MGFGFVMQAKKPFLLPNCTVSIFFVAGARKMAYSFVF